MKNSSKSIGVLLSFIIIPSVLGLFGLYEKPDEYDFNKTYAEIATYCQNMTMTDDIPTKEAIQEKIDDLVYEYNFHSYRFIKWELDLPKKLENPCAAVLGR